MEHNKSQRQSEVLARLDLVRPSEQATGKHTGTCGAVLVF